MLFTGKAKERDNGPRVAGWGTAGRDRWPAGAPEAVTCSTYSVAPGLAPHTKINSRLLTKHGDDNA